MSRHLPARDAAMHMCGGNPRWFPTIKISSGSRNRPDCSLFPGPLVKTVFSWFSIANVITNYAGRAEKETLISAVAEMVFYDGE